MKKSELQSIIREEIESALGEKNILSEATKYTWDVTQHKLHRFSLGRSEIPGKRKSTYRVIDWKKGQTVTVKAETSLDAVQLALAKVWTAEGNLNVVTGEARPLESYERPKYSDVKQFSGSVKKR